MDKFEFSYAVLQYRHDYSLGEALNVGVMLYCEKAKFVQLKVRASGGRILSAYPDLARSSFTQDLKQVALGFSRLQDQLKQNLLFEVSDWLQRRPGDLSDGDLAKSIAYRVLKHDASSFRWEGFGSGVTDSPETSLASLYERFVMQFEDAPEKHSRADEQIFEPAKKMLKDIGIYKKFDEHTVSSDLQSVKFPHALKNGRWHCVQPLSFDLTTTEWMERKAATWTGNLFNIQGKGDAFQVYILAGRPANESLMPAYERALKILNAAPTSPVVFDEDHADDLVDRLVEVNKSIQH
jgi:hypothetical protein